MTILGIVVFVAAALASNASAALVPPGNAGATQYSETIPGAAGEESQQPIGASAQPTNGQESGKGKDGTKSSAVPAQSVTEFQGMGADGEAALSLAEAGAPPRPNQKGDPKEGQRDGDQGRGGQEKSRGGAYGPGGGNDAGSSSGSTAEALGSTQSDGSSGLGQVLGGAVGTSGTGLDFLQPLILATTLIAAGGYFLRRRGPDSSRS